MADFLSNEFESCQGRFAVDFIYFFSVSAVNLFAGAVFQVDVVDVSYKRFKFFLGDVLVEPSAYFGG